MYRSIGATGVQVVGTLGNLLVIGSLSGSVGRHNARTVGRIFIVNLACSDLIVTAVINPVAVAGAYSLSAHAGTDRRTDRHRTPYRYTDPGPHTMQAVLTRRLTDTLDSRHATDTTKLG